MSARPWNANEERDNVLSRWKRVISFIPENGPIESVSPVFHVPDTFAGDFLSVPGNAPWIVRSGSRSIEAPLISWIMRKIGNREVEEREDRSRFGDRSSDFRTFTANLTHCHTCNHYCARGIRGLHYSLRGCICALYGARLSLIYELLYSGLKFRVFH